MPPDPELSLQKRAYTTEDLFCGTRFLQRLETCLVEMFLKLHFMGKIILIHHDSL